MNNNKSLIGLLVILSSYVFIFCYSLWMLNDKIGLHFFEAFDESLKIVLPIILASIFPLSFLFVWIMNTLVQKSIR